MMNLVDALAEADGPQTAQELALATGMPVATVRRLTGGLVRSGLLERVGHRLRIGIKAAVWAHAAVESIDLHDLSRPYLHALTVRTGENAEIQVRLGSLRVCVEMVPSPQSLRPIVEIGQPLPLAAGSAGKVLLAYMPEELALQVVPMQRGHGPNAITDIERMVQEWRRVRQRGYAWSIEERASGVGGVSAPVFDHMMRCVAALCISAPAGRLPAQRIREVGALLLDTARELSLALGAPTHLFGEDGRATWVL